MSKNSVGAPSKYKDEYCAELREHMARGLSFESYAGKIGVSRDCLYKWLDSHPEFVEAKAEAFELNRLWWEELCVAHVLNKSESFGEGQGSKSSSLNSTVFIFNMKNRFPKEWRDRSEVEQNTKVELTQADKSLVNEYAAKSIEFFDKAKK